MTLLPKILAKKRASSEVIPKGVSFDGATDYLSRSSDFVGNVDSKTFTFSCWVYHTKKDTLFLYDNNTIASDHTQFYVTTTGQIRFTQSVASTTQFYWTSTDTTVVKKNTWQCITASCDVETQTGKVYIGDTEVPMTFQFHTITTVLFSKPAHYIGSTNAGYTPSPSRLYGIFLDYTYRDLSIEANRRLFITEDGLPA